MNYKGYEIEVMRDQHLVEGLLFSTLQNAKWYVGQVVDDGAYAERTSYAMTCIWEQYDGKVFVHNRGWVAEWSGEPLKHGARPFFGP